jgi:DNA replication protein DnaC
MNIIKNVQCECCKSEFKIEHEKEMFDFLEKFAAMGIPTLCDPCQEAADREQERRIAFEKERQRMEKIRARKEKAETELNDKTPPRYRETDIESSEFNRRLWDKVSSWMPTNQKPWLGLIGPSGACKTRCAYLKLKQLVLNPANEMKIPSFELVTAYGLAESVRRQYHKDHSIAESARQYLRSLATVDVLLFDDLGKAKSTPAVSAELFSVIDQRHERNLVTLWTANSTPEAIVNGIDEDMAGPLAGRLNDCSVIVLLK